MSMKDAVVAKNHKRKKTVTENGMKTYTSSTNHNVDLFYTIGDSRNKDITPAFQKAYAENDDLALRIAQWARDVRGGAGERQVFRDILLYLERQRDPRLPALIKKVPEIGRWDDLLVFTENKYKDLAAKQIKDALADGNGLCAKWMPRKGKVAAELRKRLGMTPKTYRKTLVNLTKVVEQQMCANKWEDIDFNAVPSVASARYQAAFTRHVPEQYGAWKEALASGDENAKINADAIFPHDVLKTVVSRSLNNAQDERVIIAQWDALPDYGLEKNVLPMIDVSGSMGVAISGSTTAMDVAISLGLYIATKTKGAFKDMYMTFSSKPTIDVATGTIIDKVNQVKRAEWGFSTNLEAAFNALLKVAVKYKVPEDEMPEYIMILSDMQFDTAVKTPNSSAIQMIKKEYKKAGYKLPKIVFWNLNGRANQVPVKATKNDVALVSGFSPAIMTSLLADIDSFTPENVMLKTVMKERYDLNE